MGVAPSRLTPPLLTTQISQLLAAARYFSGGGLLCAAVVLPGRRRLLGDRRAADRPALQRTTAEGPKWSQQDTWRHWWLDVVNLC